MELVRKHITFLKEDVAIDELSHGEMFLIFNKAWCRPVFFLGITKTKAHTVTFNYKLHGGTHIYYTTWNIKQKVFRRLY